MKGMRPEAVKEKLSILCAIGKIPRDVIGVKAHIAWCRSLAVAVVSL